MEFFFPMQDTGLEIMASLNSYKTPPEGGAIIIPTFKNLFIFKFYLEANYFTILWWFCHTFT